MARANLSVSSGRSLKEPLYSKTNFLSSFLAPCFYPTSRIDRIVKFGMQFDQYLKIPANKNVVTLLLCLMIPDVNVILISPSCEPEAGDQTCQEK